MKRAWIPIVIAVAVSMFFVNALFAQSEGPGSTTISPATIAAGALVSVAAPTAFDDQSKKIEMLLQAFVNLTTNEPTALDSTDGGWVVIAPSDKAIDDGSGTTRFDVDTTGWAPGDWPIRAVAGGYVYVPATLHVGE